MKSRLFVLLCLFLPYLSSKAQKTKHELGISLFGYNEKSPSQGWIANTYYLAILNNVIYKYQLSEKVKIRGVLTSEAGQSRLFSGRSGFLDHSSGFQVLGLSAGAETVKDFGKFSVSAYTDILYRYKLEWADINLHYVYHNYNRNISSLGTRMGCGFEYDLTARLSLRCEPAIILTRDNINGTDWSPNPIKKWNDVKENSIEYRPLNMFVVNVKF